MLAGLRRYAINLPVDYLQRSFLLGSLGAALIFVLLNFVLSWPWLNQPFAGFLHRNWAVTESRLPGWPAPQPPIKAGDVVLAVDGQTLAPARWPDYLRRQAVNQPITYLVQSDKDQTFEVTLPLSVFTAQDFIQWVAAPIFVALVALITAGVVIYFQSPLLTVKLFGLFTLAMVFFIASLPDFVMGQLFPLNFISAIAGGVFMPPLLLHFLFLCPARRKILERWPFLLPLIYLPVLPALIYVPTLIEHPETLYTFNRFIVIYLAIYMAIGLLLLLETAVRTDNPLTRKQAVSLLLGFALPASLVILKAVLIQPKHLPIYQILDRYAFIAIPLAVAFTVIRYDMFEIDRASRWYVSYLETLGILAAGYILFVLAINPVAIDFSWISWQDLRVIGYAIAGFFIVRPLYRSGLRWFEVRFRGSVEDFRIGLRIFSHDLLKVKSRRDLEALVSWDIPTDFRLKSAELAPDHRPNSPYALRLPLSVSNISLGTLFLGAKIDGTSFTRQEEAIFNELQKQVSLALWSLELDKAIHAIEALTRLKSKFLANVTHELRTPLNGIINYIGFVLDGDVGPLNEEQVAHLNRALQNAEKLLEIINNILDMSKIEAGQMTFHIRPVDLGQVVANLIPVVEEIIGPKPVTLVTEISPALPTLHSDRLRLRQIMLNLLSNAAKFTQAGTIRLNIYPEDGYVVIQVSDTGPGIDEARLPTLFQQFASASLTDIGSNFGPGLGLSITKSLVELQGGRIEVESHKGRGTIFTVALPMGQP